MATSRDTGGVAALDLEQLFRAEWPRILATMVRFTGSIELAEDSIQLAFERAAKAPDRGLVMNPGAWITTAAKRIAIDTVRRDAAMRKRLPLLAERADAEPAAVDDAPGGDDRLGLLFVACTPELGPEARLALALRFVGGLPTREVASVMLVGHTAMNARITRAKQQIQREGIRFGSSADVDRAERIDDVRSVIHSMYTVGHTANSSPELGSSLLVATSIELARALLRETPDDRESAGLLALFLLTHARDRGRVDVHGKVVSLESADRTLWDGDLILEGLDLAALALDGGGRFALEAGISGLHSQPSRWADTDWASICALYDRLVAIWPSPAVLIARIVARSYSEVGAERTLGELEALTLPKPLDRQVLAARADMLRRMGRAPEARAAYGLARSLEQNSAIADFYDRQMDALP